MRVLGLCLGDLAAQLREQGGVDAEAFDAFFDEGFALFVGQAVAALVTRHYGIPAEALSMYRFTELPKPKVFKDGYRELLDNAPLTDEQREALIEECVEGFRINASLFAQLGRKVAEA